MPSRQVHKVRVVSPDNPDQYIEITVTDALGLGAPNGQAIFFDCSKPDPLVIDNTGDGSGREAAAPTRKSHMERLTNPDDPANAMDVEILDAFGFIGPNGQQTFYSIPNTNNYQSADPSSAAPFTRDGEIKTFTDPSNPANVLQVMTVKELTTGNAGTYAPPERYGEIAFKLDDSNVLDTTRVSPPPKNTDPNPYIKLLPGKAPWLGRNVIVKQGPLWKITDVKWGGGLFGVLEIEITWGSSGGSSSQFSDTPLLSGWSWTMGGVPVSVIDVVRLPPTGEAGPTVFTKQATAHSPAILPYSDPQSEFHASTATVVDQDLFFFTPFGFGGFPFSGVFNRTGIRLNDGSFLDVSDGPFGSPAECAERYFLFDYPGDTFTGWINSPQGGGFLTSGFDFYGEASDLAQGNLIEHTIGEGTTSFTDTVRALVFFDLGKIKAAANPHDTLAAFDVQFGGTTRTTDLYFWSASFATFTGHKIEEFTADAEDVPTWAFLPMSATEQNSRGVGESTLAPATAHFTIRFADWAVASSQHDT